MINDNYPWDFDQKGNANCTESASSGCIDLGRNMVLYPLCILLL